jgi:hypothetical protein
VCLFFVGVDSFEPTPPNVMVVEIVAPDQTTPAQRPQPRTAPLPNSEETSARPRIEPNSEATPERPRIEPIPSLPLALHDPPACTAGGECVVQADECKPGFISCAAWCVKYRPEQAPGYQGCLWNSQNSCLSVHRSQTACVRDRFVAYHDHLPLRTR